jgi:hypothetical protein
MSGPNVLKIDRDSITLWQKDLCTSNKKDEEIGTRFYNTLEKMGLSSKMDIKLEAIPKEGEVVYTSSKKFDFLHSLKAVIKLNHLKVQDKYKNKVRIAYHHNLAHNILYLGECKIDGEHFGTIDTIYEDIHLQYFQKKRKIYRQRIGAVPCLEEWSDVLPGLTLTPIQHFSFCRNDRVALPILKSNNNVITFEYKVRTKITDLLRMQILGTDGEWKEILPNVKYLEGNNKNIPIPEMWGEYSELDDSERNWRKSIDDRTGQPFKQVLYIEDVEMISSKNARPIGTEEEIPIGCIHPVKHYFWVASLSNGNYSNYTTNKNNVREGWNPCAFSGIKYGNSDRTEKLPHEHFDQGDRFPKSPYEAGYNSYTYTYSPIDIQKVDIGVIPKATGTSINVVLEDTNPYLLAEEDQEYYDDDGEPIPKEALEDTNDQSKKDKYIVHIRAVFSRKMEIYWDEKDTRLKYVYVNN